MKLKFFIAVVLVVQILASCTTYRPDDLGMQIGVVRKIYPAGVTPPDYPECLVPVDSGHTEGRYVEIEFAQAGSKRYVNSFVSEEIGLILNDKILVGSPYCIGSHKPKIMQKKS